MSRVYRITPLEKKSISATYEMYRENPDGTISWFNIEDHYRWGQGFIEEDMDVNLPYKDNVVAYCDPNAGWGAELDDQVAVSFEFSDDLGEEEQQAIKDAYEQGGAGWLYEGDHDWQEEDSSIVVAAPFRIDLCEEDGTVIQENIQPRERPAVDTSNKQAWPFPV